MVGDRCGSSYCWNNLYSNINSTIKGQVMRNENKVTDMSRYAYQESDYDEVWEVTRDNYIWFSVPCQEDAALVCGALNLCAPKAASEDHRQLLVQISEWMGCCRDLTPYGFEAGQTRLMAGINRALEAKRSEPSEALEAKINELEQGRIAALAMASAMAGRLTTPESCRWTFKKISDLLCPD
jgi:hypothetical protein